VVEAEKVEDIKEERQWKILRKIPRQEKLELNQFKHQITRDEILSTWNWKRPASSLI
jgi:hypothetical protein